MIMILRHKLDPNSPWKPYLDILPTSFEEHPLFWPEEDLEQTFLTAIPDYYLKTMSTLNSSYNYLVNSLIKVCLIFFFFFLHILSYLNVFHCFPILGTT